jgi:hypothetical protein
MVLSCYCLRSNSRNRAITTNVKCTSHWMDKLRQRTVLSFFPLRGLWPRAVQTELSDVHHDQSFQLLAVEKCYLQFAGRTLGLEDGSKSGRLRRTDLVSPIAELLRTTPSISSKAIWRRLKIPKTTHLRVVAEALGLTKGH